MKRLLRRLNTSKFARVFALFAFFALTIGGVAFLRASGANQVSASVAGGECDDNAIIRCGVERTELSGAVAGLDNEGKSAFANAGIPGSCSFGNTVTGVTTSDNKVIVGGKVVATNVYTYGRQPIQPGSSPISGGAWKRQPSVSFRSQSITSYVCMDGQEFKWAVISTCGNPVTGTPTFKNNPRLSIQKTANKTVVQPNETFNYSVTVRNTGNIALRNVVVADILPRGLEPVGLNPGVTYNPANRKITWPTIPNLAVGQQLTKVFKVKVQPNAANGPYKNIACVITNQNPNAPLCDDVTIIVKRPSLRIEKDVSVTAPVDVNQEFTYTIKVTNTGPIKITNAHIVDTLPDGVVAVDNPNSRTVEFTILELLPGQSKTRSFKARATVSAPVNTILKNVACIDRTDQTDKLICDDADIKVKTPIYACDALTATKIDNNTYRFNLAFTAQNGATLTNIAYNFGDNSPIVNTTNTTVDRDYAPGTYQARATLTFNVNGETKVVTSDNCAKQITVEPEPVFACNALGIATTDADQQLPFIVSFNATATASNGAVIQSYLWNFGDGQTTETPGNSVNHSYTAVGNYTATVQVKTNLGTTLVSPACSVNVEVKETPKEPVYTCDLLTITKIADRQYSYKVTYTALNGPVLKNIAYDFGDGTPLLNTLTNPVEHTYAQAGEYKATVALTFTVNGQDKIVTSDACMATTDKPPVIPKCPYPGKEHLPKDSPDCVVTPVTPTPPTVLPDTGVGDVIGVVAATMAAGMVAYRIVWLRQYR